MEGRKNIWEARPSKRLSMPFEMTGEVIIIRNVGEYDKVLKRPWLASFAALYPPYEDSLLPHPNHNQCRHTPENTHYAIIKEYKNRGRRWERWHLYYAPILLEVESHCLVQVLHRSSARRASVSRQIKQISGNTWTFICYASRKLVKRWCGAFRPSLFLLL